VVVAPGPRRPRARSDAGGTSQLGAALREDDAARLLDRPAAEVGRDAGLLRVPNRDGRGVYPVCSSSACGRH